MSEEKLIYLNKRGESIIFSRFSPYHVNFKDIVGLSDVRSTVYSFNSMGQDGDTFLGNRIESRDIEIPGHINATGKERVAQLKRHLNNVMNPHLAGTLIYERGDFRRLIKCEPESIQIVRGTILETMAIQLLCLSPFWREENEVREDIASWIGNFYFPDDEGGLALDDSEGWIIMYREPSLIVNVNNSGDVSTGIRVDFRALGILTNPSILNINTGEFIRVNMQLAAGDVLTVSTGYGEKSVTLLRGGITSNVFRHLDPDSTYLQLAVGDNLFRYDADSNLESLEVSIYHNRLYLGV